MDKFILKISCEDEKGLVYKITKVLYEFGLNIIVNHEFVDREYGKFFFRAVFEAESDFEVGGVREAIADSLPKDSYIYLDKKSLKNIAILATKEAHCLGDLLIKFYSKEINANIKCIISNHDNLKGLADKFSIPYHFVSAKDIDRQTHEELVLKELSKYELDYIVLAKYMRILSPKFIKEYDGKIINIHHSFLPAFIGANPYKQAHQRGVKIIGATAHFVNDNLDEGPIISQDVVRINHEMSWEEMREAGKYVEKSVLSHAIDLVLDDRIFVYNNKTVVF